MQYNSSFAGSAGKSRISSSVSFNKWKDGTSNSSGFNMYASYDSFLPRLRSGIGIEVTSYRYSSSTDLDSIEYHSSGKGSGLSFVIAPKLSIKGKYTLSPSLRIGYYNSHFDYFENDPNWEPETYVKTGLHHRLSSGVGLLFNTERYYIGYSVDLFSGEFGEIKLNSFYSDLQFGYTFQRDEQSKFSFTPQLRVEIRSKNESDQHNVSKPSYNLGLRYGQLLVSIFSSNEFKPTGFQIGWQKDGWRIVSSNEFDLNKYYNRYYPSLSVRYIFNQGKESIHIYEESNF